MTSTMCRENDACSSSWSSRDSVASSRVRGFPTTPAGPDHPVRSPAAIAETASSSSGESRDSATGWPDEVVQRADAAARRSPRCTRRSVPRPCSQTSSAIGIRDSVKLRRNIRSLALSRPPRARAAASRSRAAARSGRRRRGRAARSGCCSRRRAAEVGEGSAAQLGEQRDRHREDDLLTTTAQALNRTAAHTSTGSGAKPSVRYPGASVSIVAAAQRQALRSPARRARRPRAAPGTVAQQRQRREQQHRGGVGGHHQAEGAPEGGVQRRRRPGRSAPRPRGRPMVAMPNSRQTSLTSRIRRPIEAGPPGPRPPPPRRSPPPRGAARLPTDRPRVKLASAKATVRASDGHWPVAARRHQERDDADPCRGEPGGRGARLATHTERARPPRVGHHDETRRRAPARADGARVPFHSTILAHARHRCGSIRRAPASRTRPPSGLRRVPRCAP